MKRIKMSQSNGSKTIKEGFNEFIKYCKVKNLSERTIKYYTDYMTLFQDFLDQRNLHLTKEISKELINEYTLSLKESGAYNDISINTAIRAVRAIVYHFQRQGYTPQFKIILLKTDKEVKETYSQHELRILLKKPKTADFTEYRNWVKVNFLLATGVRVGELVNIKIRDIDVDEAIVKVKRSKSRRERHIPLSKTMLKILVEYITTRNPETVDDYLFCNAFGNKLREDSCNHAIGRYNNQRGVDKTSVHLFRHTFAKMYILNGGDIFRLQKLLGHRGIETVKEYVNMFSNDVQIDFDKFSPLEQLTADNKTIKL